MLCFPAPCDALRSCASKTSCLGLVIGGGTPTTSAGTVRRPAPRWSRVWAQGGHCGPRPTVEVPPRPLRTPPPGRGPAAPAYPARGAGTRRPCGTRRPARRCGGQPGTAGRSAGTNPPPVGTSARSAACTSSRERWSLADPPPWVGLVGPGVGQRPRLPAPRPPTHGPAATWLEVANAVHALFAMVSDIKWATLPEPREIHATALWPHVLRRVDPGLHRDRLHYVT